MWVAPDIRDNVVDFVNYWSQKTEIKISDARRIVGDCVEYYNSKRLHSAIGI
ncbi:hypothetical protein JCM12298_05540 [Desulfothermus naphthae]